MTNYIFISYAHKDTERVMPVIKKLCESGYNVWYDDGIDPGTEWAVNIATHIEGCAYFIAFMSRAYLDSLNCREEWNFARDEQKKRFLVYIEDVKLPNEMRLRSGMIQNLFMHKYEDAEMFYSKLFAAPGIEMCRKTEPEKETKQESEGVEVEVDELKHIQGLSEQTDGMCEESHESVDLVAIEQEKKESYILDGVDLDWPEIFRLKEMKRTGEIIISKCLKKHIAGIRGVRIPSSINGMQITGIGKSLFENCTDLQRVELPKGITKIESRAFAGCQSLQEIVIPCSVKEIGEGAFDGCENLENVLIPSNMMKIAGFTFQGCKKLKKIRIPENAIEIGTRAFSECTGLEEIQIPDSVKIIGYAAFADCRRLQKIHIPENIREIGFFAFARCNSLEDFKLPKQIKKRTEDVFCRDIFNELF